MSPVVHFHTLLSYNCHFFIFLLLYKLHGGDHVLLHVWSITHTQSCPFYCFLCPRRLHLFLGNYPKPELSHGQSCMWWSGIESMSSFIFMLMTFTDDAWVPSPFLLLLAVLGLGCCAGFSLAVASRRLTAINGFSCLGARAECSNFSSCSTWFLGAKAQAQGVWSTGLVAL